MPSQAYCGSVKDFLSESPFKGFIGGQWVDSVDGARLSVCDPGTGEQIAEVAAMSGPDVELAVHAAEHAFHSTSWAKMPTNERGVLLHRLADAVEQHKSVIAQIESLDAGKILEQAAGDVQNFVDTLRYFVEISLHVQHHTPLAVAGYEAARVHLPWGPCGFIFPWNFPFLLIGWNIAPALAAGNTVVIKPAEDTPLSCLYLARLAQQVGIPAGVINVITGYGETAGAALAAHPRLKRMAFTGSPQIGRLVAESCGRNLIPVKLELGGKGAAVLFEDIDIDATADALVSAITFHAGQVCCNATRWIVHRQIFDNFVNACVSRLQTVRVGHQLDDATQMGPVVNSKQRERIIGYLEQGQVEGADVVLPGGMAKVEGCNGFYVKPALLAGNLNNVAAREEIFGPVAYLTPFKNEEEALEMVNSTDYGLANSVWTTDLERANRVAQSMIAGNSWINSHNVFIHGVPYGGINKSGLGGGVLSGDTYFDYTRGLSVVRPL